MLTLRYRLRPEDEQLTLRAVLRERMGLSYAQTRSLKGQVTLDGRSVYLNQPAPAEGMLAFPLPQEQSAVVPASGDVHVLYEDEALLAVHKPAGLESHPHRGGVSMLNLALGFVRGREPAVCLHPIHRLDADTEGVLLFAKHGCMQALLTAQMMRGDFYKEYEGIVRGRFAPPDGSIRLPIDHDPARGPARFIAETGKGAWTDYQTLHCGEWQGSDVSCVRFLLHTGRTHQIRVHAAALGHPLLGDTLYGGGTDCAPYRLCAVRLCFTHPLTQARMDIRTTPSWMPCKV